MTDSMLKLTRHHRCHIAFRPNPCLTASNFELKVEAGDVNAFAHEVAAGRSRELRRVLHQGPCESPQCHYSGSPPSHREGESSALPSGVVKKGGDDDPD